MNLKEAIQIAVKASSEGKFDIAERTCREILKHLEAYSDDGIRFSIFTSVNQVLAIILTHVGRLDEAANILRRLYISTLSSKSLEYSLLNARKQGCLDDFGKFDDWLSIQSGKTGMVRGLVFRPFLITNFQRYCIGLLSAFCVDDDFVGSRSLKMSPPFAVGCCTPWFP